MPNNETSPALAASQVWLDRAVIGLNLCPFAKAVQVRGKIRWVESTAADEAGVLPELIRELAYLNEVAVDDEGGADTTLIVIPHLFASFEDFNDFLGECEDELWVQGFEGVFQLASFHPRYQFADTQAADPENNTNRAPYPTLHILREASVDVAVAAVPDTDAIYQRNIATMNQLGNAGFERLLGE
jgi:uncharacterized protein